MKPVVLTFLLFLLCASVSWAQAPTPTPTPVPTVPTLDMLVGPWNYNPGGGAFTVTLTYYRIYNSINRPALVVDGWNVKRMVPNATTRDWNHEVSGTLTIVEASPTHDRFQIYYPYADALTPTTPQTLLSAFTWLKTSPPVKMPPEPIGVDIEPTDFEGGTAGIYVDTDGDGDFDRVGEVVIGPDGSSPPLPFDPEWEDKPYKVILEKTRRDGFDMPLNYELEAGTFGGGGVTVGGTIDGGDVELIPWVSIGPDGAVTNDPIVTGTPVINGQPHYTYTYNTPSGPTSVVYGTSGTNGVTSQDVRMATVQNSKENAAILSQLKSMGSTLGDIADSVAPTPTPTPEPTPGPTPTPSPTPGNLTSEDVATVLGPMLEGISKGDDEVAGLAGAGAPSSEARVSAGSDGWVVNLFGYSMDLNPMSLAGMTSLASWVRNLLLLLALAIVITEAYRFLFQFQGYESLQPLGTTLGIKANVESMVAAASASWGIGGAVLLGIVLVIFFAITSLVATSFIALLISFPSIISGTMSFESWGTASVTTGFSLGGSNIFNSIWSHVQTAPGWLGRFVWLLDQFVPLAHFVVCAANLLTMKAWGTFVLRVLATLKRLIPGGS